MKTKKTLLALAVFFVFFTWGMAWKSSSGLQSGISALQAADQGREAQSWVRVVVRFAKIRSLPSAGARAIREIGFGTLLSVLGENGEYFQVALLNVVAKPGAEPWYVLRSDVEAASAAAMPGLEDTRRVTFSPAAPAAGQPLLFTAGSFHTPNLLKWDMGDGTMLTSGSKAAPGQDATLAYAYPAAGQFLVKVYDDMGNMAAPAVTVQVTVSAYARTMNFAPQRPLANHPVTITALNFHTPEKIAWDFGDGTEIKPGAGPGVVKASFLVSHIYAAPGTYTVKAYDSGGDKSQPPLTVELAVAADPRQVRMEPARAVSGKALQFSAASELAAAGGPAVSIPAKTETVSAAVALAPARKKPVTFKIGPYAGYFQPRDPLVKEIYGKGDMLYGARMGVRVWQGFYLWLSAAQFQIISKTTFTGEKTTLTLLPVSVFLRYSIGLGFFNPYAGVGFTYLSFREESAISPNTRGSGSSVALEAGFELKMNRHFSLDLGVRYGKIMAKPDVGDLEIDLGGLQAGITMLVSF